MDWTIFGNIVNVLAGLVTIGAPIFSVLKAVVRNKQSSSVPLQAISPRPQGRASSSRNSQMKSDTIPWYLWAKIIFHALLHMIEEPMIIFMYLIGGGLLVGAIFVFCILVGIPVGWLNEGSLGARVFLLCVLLIISLHFSVEFAECSDGFLQEQLQKQRARRKSAYHSSGNNLPSGRTLTH